MPESLLDKLNDEQRAAVLTTDPHVRIKAGPGSGKTRVVVARAWYLVSQRGIDPARILAITFTNKAANELKERLAAAGVGPSEGEAGHGGGGQVLAKTFHGLGCYFLRKAASTTPGLGINSRFRVLDAEQSERLIRRAIEEVDLEQLQAAGQGGERDMKGRPDGAASVTTHGLATPLANTDVLQLAQRLADLFSSVKTGMAAIGFHDDDRAIEEAVKRGVDGMDGSRGKSLGDKPQLPSRFESAAVAARWYRGMVQKYFCMYRRLLLRNNAVDFSDLICLPVRLLDQHPELVAAWRARFDHILVDEFQDTDPAQYKLVRQLKGPTTSLFVVGDPDQAIYGWRGAEVSNMSIYLPRDFPDTKTHMLSINYRSDPAIVKAADRVLCANGPSDLYTPAVPARAPAAGRGVATTLHVYPDHKDEAYHIARLIRGWMESGEMRAETAAPAAAAPLLAAAAAATAATRAAAGQRQRSARAGAEAAGEERGAARQASGNPAAAAPREPRWREVAVLYRNRDLSRPLEEAFTRSGIPFTVVGGQPFWQYKEIADAVAYMHVLLDPLRCDVFLERIINEPKRSVGDKSLLSMRDAARAAGMPLSQLIFGDCVRPEGATPPPRPPIEALPRGPADLAALAPGIGPDSPLKAVKLTKAAAQGLQELRGLVLFLRDEALRGTRMGGLLQACLTLSGYEAVLKALEVEGKGRKLTAKSKKDVSQDASERLERLETLTEFAGDPDSWIADDSFADDAGGLAASAAAASGSGGAAARDAGLLGVARFLEHAALVTGELGDAKGDRNAVRLSTLHAAKGLEFERVFIVGLEDSILPSPRSPMDEERRLFYVGLTRAKDQLFVSYCKVGAL
ncbi:hypothetical protein GPECTOR_32g501 [Gonium pectorale]|uniref:DNA 3'-5' helicase n=1 Tax=Gonium pectorale TaxID=33097 RepID=A0A150GDK1_GONPE|nr:hypothetical protein GPECTOR_32g501 [Gonium pectorale]|eukprot:KXZ47888.1 hypothetical protein GPECTOR_32g501 [Gonium pectorale]